MVQKGEVAERSNATVLKTVVRSRGPGVRIPPSPPVIQVKPNMKNKLSLKTILYSLITVFVFIVAYFFIPFSESIKRASFLLVAILGLIFLVLGVILILRARKEQGKLKLFLMLTGISAISPLIFTILHNLFYGLAMVFKDFDYLFEALHVAFFIISLVVAPVGFIIGVIGTLIFFKKQKR